MSDAASRIGFRLRHPAVLPVLAGMACSLVQGQTLAQAQTAKTPAPLPPATAMASAPAIGCPSLANLRLLLRQSEGDAKKAAATLADPKADHLGCSLLGRDTVNAITDHAALNGNDYDCVGVTGTSICSWTIAGTVVPADPARAPKKTPPAKTPPGKSRP
ncbi:hypothetical protein [Methylobacterium marchantiae]|uniref:Uncharacterized protein n=1 Tax=Methylobacterium marchantiae TaxID=600331 RepID=A0ABW3X1Z3_9HYPH|nr:hypothetical protein AIGOOFII_3630 [Methylobacterium marchantiae]